jgi:hypothetical protein
LVSSSTPRFSGCARDIRQENDNDGFEGGTWSSNYSRYRDDDILTVSSIDRGLFVLETDVDD